MLTAAFAVAEETAHEASNTPIAIGLLAFVGLMALLFTAIAFRSVGSRH